MCKQGLTPQQSWAYCQNVRPLLFWTQDKSATAIACWHWVNSWSGKNMWKCQVPRLYIIYICVCVLYQNSTRYIHIPKQKARVSGIPVVSYVLRESSRERMHKGQKHRKSVIWCLQLLQWLFANSHGIKLVFLLQLCQKLLAWFAVTQNPWQPMATHQTLCPTRQPGLCWGAPDPSLGRPQWPQWPHWRSHESHGSHSSVRWSQGSQSSIHRTPALSVAPEPRPDLAAAWRSLWPPIQIPWHLGIQVIQMWKGDWELFF